MLTECVPSPSLYTLPVQSALAQSSNVSAQKDSTKEAVMTGELMSKLSFWQSWLKVPCMVAVRVSFIVRTRFQAEAVEMSAVRKRRTVASCILVFGWGVEFEIRYEEWF